MALRVSTITTGRWKQNCYVVADESNECLVIDPGEGINEIFDVLKELKPLAILNTHGHYDHVAGVADIKTRFQVPFHLHLKDEGLVKRANFYRQIFGGERVIGVPTVEVDLASVDLIEVGAFRVKIIATPGHTAGSVCLQIDDELFTGDTLFESEIGRTDLPGGNIADLKISLRRLLSFPKYLRIHPGHGPSATLGDVLNSNEKLREAIA